MGHDPEWRGWWERGKTSASTPARPRHSLHGVPDSSSRMGPSLPGTEPNSYQRNGTEEE